ncbi:MAG: hypothetical protein KIT84_07135 [Labilithrix sp.]|nr:hypothetical protein [Labilithrix sp.]MCW5810768.1 hypothetical protein [Labilithrix sp.]
MNRALGAFALSLVALGGCKEAATPVRASAVPVGAVANGPAPTVPGPCALPNEAEALAPEDATDRPIRAICIHGVPATMKQDVLAYLREKPGHLYRASNLSSDVRALYDSGFFRWVTVTAAPAGTGLDLHFELTPRPVIRAATIEGADRIAPDPEQPIAKVGAFYSKATMTASARALRERYVAEGFDEAAVETTVSPETPAGVDVHVTVKEGTRTTVGALAIAGASPAFEAAIRKLPELASGAPLGAKPLGEAYQRVEQLFADRAYYGRIDLERGARGPDGSAPLTLTIDARGPFRVGKVAIAVDPALDRDLAKALQMKSGDVAERARIRAGIERVKDTFRARGRSESLTIEPTMDPSRKIVDLTIELERP